MEQVIYTCPFVPAEWIAAHGLRPARIIPHSARMHAAIPPIEGLCPFAQGFANHVIADKESQGAIFTTACDQMRRVHDLVVGRATVKTFLMNLPKTRNTECTELYMDELRRLGRWLRTIGGHAPAADTLTGTMVDFDEHRQAMRSAGCNSRPSCSCHDGFVKLALIGGHLLAGEMQLLDLVTRHGGRIMLDATETGELTRPTGFDPAGLREDPLRELARCYFESIPAVWKRPNTALFDWLILKCAERQVRGIICHRLVWCDLWHAEVHRLREALQLPLLDLDVGDDGPSAERTAGRIQAFLETLR
jgi:benzoyl-CoA reductase/2-hydroxyglutaryl-CoA dehydratase subunit BcrC/BadD/HgdB